MKKLKILITGITGRIGSRLAKSMIEAGHQVRGLAYPDDSKLEKLKSLDLELVYGNLMDPDSVKRAVEGMEVICHLGADTGKSSNSEFFQTNVQGSFNVLEAAVKKVPNLIRFFFASSDAVYQKCLSEGSEIPLKENETPIEPVGWYVLSKVIGEEMCQAYRRRYQLPIVIFRFSHVFGLGEILKFPRFYLRYWLEKFYEKAESDLVCEATFKNLHAMWSGYEPLLVARDAKGRAYKMHAVDVRDIVHGFFCALENEAAVGEVFQLAASSPMAWDKAVPYLSKALNVHYVEASLVGIAPTYYEHDISKARRLIGYSPQYDVFRMIDDAISYQPSAVSNQLRK